MVYCIQNFYLGRNIVRYTVRNLVLRRRATGAVKRDFRTYIRRYTSPNENFEYGYPYSNAHLQFPLKLKRYKPHKSATLLIVKIYRGKKQGISLYLFKNSTFLNFSRTVFKNYCS